MNKPLTIEEKQALLRAARTARDHAYAPYSGFAVGAAVLGESGKVYPGCNVENSSYPAGNCAERGSVAAAICGGEKRLRGVLIVGGPAGQEPEKECLPCGICRQVLLEHGGEELPVLTLHQGQLRERRLVQLLPEGFTLAEYGKSD